MNVAVIQGMRQGTVLYHCHDGFYYYFNNGKSYEFDGGNATSINLRCKNWTSQWCHGTARILIYNGRIQWTNLLEHTCPADEDFHLVRQLRGEIIQESVNLDGPFETPAEVLNRVRERFDVDVAARITNSAMRSIISRARGGLYPNIPGSLEELGNLLNDNPHLSATQDEGDNFFAGMVRGRGPGTISLVFFSERMRQYLARTRVVSCDGTFKSRPILPNSAQLLQIVGVIDYHATPLVQVLMTGKSEEEYVAVLRFLQQRVPRFRPRIVITDFEAAMQNAWREVYRCPVCGCYWHHCRAVTLKTRHLGLTGLLREDRICRSIARSLLAVPLLPKRYMERGVRVLIAEAHREGRLDQLNALFDYYTDTWFSASAFESLSVYRAEHRTNNCAETANKMFGSKTGANRPGVYRFLSALRKYEREAFTTQRTLDAGLPINRPRTVQAMNNDIMIMNYTNQLRQGRISIRTFLHRASTRVMNVYNFFLEPVRQAGAQ
ncbi:uncharacterized protein LOC117643894 [Thrips palmi]|uniref:Uncharacterized protein LOC117643894 n=1 Tax=Thrips palmi TaxID=161013 RepID=A0A6P8YXK4_THRPL|nr:uncharacterized protein LOC117643894 [Thrips palmi]